MSRTKDQGPTDADVSSDLLKHDEALFMLLVFYRRSQDTQRPDKNKVHGYGVKKIIQNGPEFPDLEDIHPASLYQRIAAFEEAGWIERETDLSSNPSDDDTRRIYYKITEEGKKVFEQKARERLAYYGKAQNLLLSTLINSLASTNDS